MDSITIETDREPTVDYIMPAYSVQETVWSIQSYEQRKLLDLLNQTTGFGFYIASCILFHQISQDDSETATEFIQATKEKWLQCEAGETNEQREFIKLQGELINSMSFVHSTANCLTLSRS